MRETRRQSVLRACGTRKGAVLGTFSLTLTHTKNIAEGNTSAILYFSKMLNSAIYL